MTFLTVVTSLPPGQSSIGAEKNGVVHPDGWESPVTYAIGRGDNYFLQVHSRAKRKKFRNFLRTFT